MARIASNQFVGLTLPFEYDEFVIGTFDPHFKNPSETLRFFKGWSDVVEPGSVVAEFVAYRDFDQALRFSKDDAEYEMLMIQGCVGAETYLYLLPYLSAYS